ncbi:acid phosphatase [Cohnella pontilimi]|uniref:Acid phosphatase n=1 Tax=Cohnella pontilimi TaxID=2564100 RepID=A0A4U0FGP0_9BACL|nr:alkaline phosphatase family protein [Cohnella pontilimi]TJY44068.1 acid phosphatase [Cohnella pontilimi]
MNRRSIARLLILSLAFVSACTAKQPESAGPTQTYAAVPTQTAARQVKADHIVIVIEENHSYRSIYNNPKAPYMNQLIKSGANLANHYATRHPSQPNYLDLFSGSNQGVFTDKMPKKTFNTSNLASELIQKGYTFGGYSESLPKIGFTGPYDSKFKYARKHNPWVNFSNVPSSVNMPFTSFPKDYNKLPTVSIVVPNLDHDIHDGTVKQADDWLRNNLSGYVKWAQTHNSLLILTWDEDDMSQNNRIPTVFVGPMVKKGDYKQKTNHYSVLRTIEDMYGLPAIGTSKNEKPLAIWK